MHKIDAIVPGKTYPKLVRWKEDGHRIEIRFQSYRDGLQCTTTLNGFRFCQTSYRDVRDPIRRLKREIRAALRRGTTVTIGSIVQVKPDREIKTKVPT